VPAVLLDREIQSLNMDSVLVDHDHGGYLAGQYLIKLGHRTFGVIGGPRDSSSSPARLLGFIRALREAGLMGAGEELGGGQEWAAALLDAVHPDGMAGVLAQASGLLNDPAAAVEFLALLEKFRRMRPATPDGKVDRLADRVAGILAQYVDGASLADADLLDKVLADRLNEAQRRFLIQLRIKLGAPE